jgi:PDZ domain
MGDRILKVNSKDLDGCTHQEAVMGLLEPQDTITLSIQHDPLPDGYKVSFHQFFLHRDTWLTILVLFRR